MFKLFIADLKMLVRNRQSLFWSLAFPLMFTVIFGFFFGNGSAGAGSIVLINKSSMSLAQNLEKGMKESDLFKIQKESDIENAKNLLKKGKIVGIISIPEGFGSQKPGVPTKVEFIYDPGNASSNVIVTSFINSYLTQFNYQIQNAKPIFFLEEQRTSDRTLNYFDFVLVGLIGLALMNSSMQGISISMSKYREDKILKRITTTPLKSWKFVLSEILSHLILNIFQISLILGIGVLFFHAHIYGNIFVIYLFALIGAVLFQSIGFVIAGLSKTTDAAQGMSMAISIPMMFLAGVFFPIDQLPKWLFSIVQYLPLAPILRIIRNVALESISPFENPTNIIIVLSWIVVMLSIAIYKFRLSDE